MNPYTDFGFKKLFGTEPNKDILISFLNAVFQGKRPSITDIRYINTEVLGPYYGSRNSVFDIYCLTEDNHTVYKKLAFYYLEMPKFNKTEDELVTMFDKWLFVIKNICYLMVKPKQLQEQVFTKFFEQARIAMFTPEEQFAYQESRKQYWDNRNTIAYSFEKGKESGIAEGKELGIAENKKETAKKMLSMGMSKEVILQVTGLTEEEFSTFNSECGIRRSSSQ